MCAATAQASESRCVDRATSTRAPAAPRKVKISPIKPTSRTLKVNLGSDSKPQTRRFAIVSPPVSRSRRLLAEIDGDLEAADSSTFAAGQTAVSPQITPLGQVTLEVCLDPATPERVGAGRYLGAISLGGKGVETTSFPLEVTVQSSGWIAALWIAIGTLFGILLKMFTDLRKTEGVQVSGAGIKKYWQQGNLYVALLTGVVAAIVDFLALYEPNPSWGSSLDEVKIFAAAVALQTTGMTITDVIKPFKPA